VAKRVDGALDQIGAVVGGFDHDARRQAVFQIGEFRLGVVNDLVGVGAEAGDDHAADGFAFAVPFADAAPFLAGDLQRGDVESMIGVPSFPRPTGTSARSFNPLRYPRLRTMYSFSLISTTDPPTSLLDR
jgi:hypothetical protein